ncbi:GntR family transcriptional regulator [Kutzneria sp. CA-103260]|uniref:GntR family transcriptional regulator n=1 Tax=Kutzneria sp. CA-103260 TaxID=2802641 RepID=UPI001BACD569|nr:GntR family transcriptional regulator [Kutzneria sp. CA-103260]
MLIARLAGEHPDSSQAAILTELRRCLLDGGVPPGSAIPLEEVAAVFGVSVIPVRESLKTLIGEGLVEHRPNLGYTVAKLTAAELREMYLVREVLETAALTASVAAAGKADDEAVERAHRAMAQAVRDGDAAAYHRESRRFHLALVTPCGMRRLLGMFESAWNITEPLQSMTHLTAAERGTLQQDHDEILAAFLARDTEELLRAARAHHGGLRKALDSLPSDTGLFA